MKDHALWPGELLSVLGRDVVLALALAELHHRDVLSPGKVLQRLHEALADRIHQSAGSKLISPVKPEETGHSLLALQLWHVHIQVHPVDTFDLKSHVLLKHLGDTARYAHFRLRLAPVLRDHLPLCGPMTEPASGSLPGRGQLSDYLRCQALNGIQLIGLRRSLVRFTLMLQTKIASLQEGALQPASSSKSRYGRIEHWQPDRIIVCSLVGRFLTRVNRSNVPGASSRFIMSVRAG